MTRYLSTWIIKIWGFRIEGDTGGDLPKKIYAVVPHTSGWDFILALCIRGAHQLEINFVGKKALFKPPLGWLMRRLGGRPVDRKRSNNLVEDIVGIFNESDRFAIALAPEGTRQKVDQLRSGFYHIARLAQVPILLVRFDFGQKVVTVAPPFHPTNDEEADFQYFDSFFDGALGKIPHLSYTPLSRK